MNILPRINYLRNYAQNADWQNASAELCERVLTKIVNDGPSEAGWNALLELLGVWSDSTDVINWVNSVETQVITWPWQLRECYLGHRALRGDKKIAYRLVGKLKIDNIEDIFGQKLKRWSEIKEWVNIRGLHLFKIESEAKYVSYLTQSPHLQQLHSLELVRVDDINGGLDLLFDNNVLPDLHQLELVGVGLKEADIDQLSKTPQAQQITFLNLASNYLNSKDLPTLLAATSFPNLKTLNLSSMTITAQPLKDELAKAKHPHLEKVIIERTPAAKSLGVTEVKPS